MATELLRMTRQREVILDEVRQTCSHPTADELYEVVRQRLPRISLATVYRNLEDLSRRGLVNKLVMGGDQKRFDGNVCPHEHVRCIQCGRVADIPEGDGMAGDGPPRPFPAGSEFRILGCRVEWYGLCPDCSGCSSGDAELSLEPLVEQRR